MLKKRLRTSSVNVGFLKSEHSRFQELEIESDYIFEQDEIKICKTDYLQSREMLIFAFF